MQRSGIEGRCHTIPAQTPDCHPGYACSAIPRYAFNPIQFINMKFSGCEYTGTTAHELETIGQ
jgi:hypothetical protein